VATHDGHCIGIGGNCAWKSLELAQYKMDGWFFGHDCVFGFVSLPVAFLFCAVFGTWLVIPVEHIHEITNHKPKPEAFAIITYCELNIYQIRRYYNMLASSISIPAHLP
jgi:hypothetical protein